MAKKKAGKPGQRRPVNVSGGQPMVSGRGGIGPGQSEVPDDQHSKAPRGHAEEELQVEAEDRPREPHLKAARVNKAGAAKRRQKKTG
jgi:hypothetical protein